MASGLLVPCRESELQIKGNFQISFYKEEVKKKLEQERRNKKNNNQPI